MKHFVHRLKHVEVPQENGKIKHPLTFTMQSKLKDCSTLYKYSLSSINGQILMIKICTSLSLTILLCLSKTAIFTYLMRWGIEESFRELKDNFCFDQYQVRDQEQIQRHWILSFLVWSLTYWIKQNACLSKILTDSPQSIGQCKEAVASLIIIDSHYLCQRTQMPHKMLKIKSQRFRERLQINKVQLGKF